MRAGAWLRVASIGLWLAGAGCTSLKEIPRGEFQLKPERERVRVVTVDGLVYEFDYARVAADSLYGFRRREVEGSVDDFSTIGMRIEDVERVSIRRVDWGRTSLIGGGVMAVLVAVGLAKANGDNGGGSGGGGKGPIP